MKSQPITWRTLLQGDTVEALVYAAREQAAAELAKTAVIDAVVKTFRVYRRDLSKIDARLGRPVPPYELELCIEYVTDMPLADWLKEAMWHVQVAEGPGKLTIEEAKRP